MTILIVELDRMMKISPIRNYCFCITGNGNYNGNFNSGGSHGNNVGNNGDPGNFQGNFSKY